MESLRPESRDPISMPKRYDHMESEGHWQVLWEDWGIHRFKREDRASPTYSIDTPPPYPSGEFHMGNALNWCYFDFVARYKRMRGFNVHFPQGWDCHGLPTEVRAETTYKVRKRDLEVSEFKDLCVRLTTDYIEKMKKAMKMMGYSIDWNLEYRTMDPDYYRLTQLSFILLFKSGYMYRGEHPVNWCPRCETAIAEAEVEYVESEGSLSYIRFKTEDGYLVIATTRPELLPACVAVAVNPQDERYRGHVGKWIEVPFFMRRIEILVDESVDSKFGSGVVMVCTFGDKTDVKWQKKYKLPIMKAISEDGHMTEEAGRYKGLTVKECQEAILTDLRREGLLEKSEKIERNIGTCWRCHTAVEIISRLQWFMKTKDMTDEVVNWTSKITWVPEFAKYRMIDWATSLDWDWVISRQRVFATPIPVWYCSRCGDNIIAEEDLLPVDPRFEKPKVENCPKCGCQEFIGESDVMDTWMDSSITCAVHAGWPRDLESFNRLFPANLQPNGLDIIRTWDYYLMVRHLALFKQAPYKTMLINGMVRGADGRMMHKSYGNYVEATEAILKYGADSLRQWAAGGAATGQDIPFRWSDVEHARRFLTKLWNASRFVIANLREYDRATEDVELQALDRWLLSRLEKVTEEVTEAFENFQFNVALESVRNFTWHVFCDQYLEAVKHRLYSRELRDRSSRIAAEYVLYHSILRILQLLAPICPHITESTYQQLKPPAESPRSIHLTRWPSVKRELIDEEVEKKGDILVAVISEIRREKSKRQASMKAPIKHLHIYAEQNAQKIIKDNIETVQRTCNVGSVNIHPLDPTSPGTPIQGYPSIRIRPEL